MLIFEIVLTRVFAITQFHHFAFVTVSLALLGFGASGSLLTAFGRIGRGGPTRWVQLAAVQSVGTVAAFGLVNRFPFDSFRIAVESKQVWLLAFNYLTVSVPFLCGGAVIGVLLAGWDQAHPVPSNQVYAFSLVGSGAGCVVALGALELLGGVGVVLLAGACAMASAFSFSLASERRSSGLSLVVAAAVVVLGVGSLRPPRFLDLELSEFKGLSAALRFPGAEVISTRWNAGSRVDHVVSDGIRSLPALSFTYAGNLPPQQGVTFDGDDLSPIPLVDPDEADFADHMLLSLPFKLRPGGEVAVLEPRGGLDVLIGLAAGAGAVTAVEPNELAIRAVGQSSGELYGDPRVEVIVEEPRVYIERTERRFDVIDVALVTPYRPVASGAYSLAEEYLLTEEALAAYVERLRPDGILTLMRWVQQPPSEEIRTLALAAESMRRSGADPSSSVVALRSYGNILVMAKPSGFDDDEVALIRSFAEELRFDLVALPGLEPAETNRYNILPVDEYHQLAAALLTTSDPSVVYADHAFDITPPTDDKPYFSHFFKWSQRADVLDSFGRSWQPFGGAGYFVVLAVLVITTLAGLALIVGPLVVMNLGRKRARPPPARAWTLGYFGLLGVAFLFVEIPIIQRYILLIGQPTRALAVVLFALLVASGAGSLSARSMHWPSTALVVAVTSAVYPAVLPWLTSWLLPADLIVRIAGGAVLLFPLGFVMGTMFPNGLAHLERTSPALVPWAWGINGMTSVVSAAAATLLALSFGSSLVMILGAGAYGLCAMLSWWAGRGRPPTLTPTG